MTIHEKFGQLFFNMGASTEPEYLKDVLDTYHISGVRYNKSNADVVLRTKQSIAGALQISSINCSEHWSWW